MTYQPQPAALRQQALALGLAAAVTAAVLSGLLGLAQDERAAQLAQHRAPAVATAPAAPAV